MEVYEAQYFYAALVEFFYFVMEYIEHHGATSILVFEEFVKLFKVEVHEFITTFEGETTAEKLMTILFTLTSDFVMLHGNMICLKKSLTNFKCNILQDFIVSKTTDLVLKNVVRIENIYCNLKINSVFSISYESFLDRIEKSGCFIINNYNLTVVNLKSIASLDNNTYKNIVQAYQNFLSLTSSLTYKDILKHYELLCVPNAITPLNLLCIFVQNKIFFCENSVITLRKNDFLQHSSRNILKLCPAANLPISLIVYKDNGAVLQNWKGEVGKLRLSAGHIYCFYSSPLHIQEELFLVYFYKTALKQLYEIKDLRNVLNLQDIVEFDAVFCGTSKSAAKIGIFWKATRVRLIKRSYEQNNQKLIDEILVERENSIEVAINIGHDIGAKDSHWPRCAISTPLMETRNTIVLNMNDLVNSSNSLGGFSCDNSNDVNLHSKQLPNKSYLKKSMKRYSTLKKHLGHVNGKTKQFSELATQPESVLLCEQNAKIKHHNIYYNYLVLNKITVMFAKADIITQTRVIATSQYDGVDYTIVCSSEIIFPDSSGVMNVKANQMLVVFVPFIDNINNLLIATLVFSLSTEEADIITKQSITPTDFVSEYIFPIISSKRYSNGQNCCNVMNLIQKDNLPQTHKSFSEHECCNELEHFFSSTVIHCSIHFYYMLHSLLKCHLESYTRLINCVNAVVFSAVKKQRLKNCKKSSTPTIRKIPIENFDEIKKVCGAEEKVDSVFNGNKNILTHKTNHEYYSGGDGLISCASSLNPDTNSSSKITLYETSKNINTHIIRVVTKDALLKKQNSSQQRYLKSTNRFYKKMKIIYLTFRSIHMFKSKRISKQNIHLNSSKNICCKNCYTPLIKTCAEIKAVSGNCLLLNTAIQQHDVMLVFHGQRIKSCDFLKLKVGMVLEVTVIPSPVKYLSEAIYLELPSIMDERLTL